MLKKVFEYLKVVVVAAGKFLHYVYAAEITVAVIGVFSIIIGSKLFGIGLIAWAVLLSINEREL
jgi:hypothetical protein